jgi:hypothetical protein
MRRERKREVVALAVGSVLCCMGRLHGRSIYKRRKAKKGSSRLVGWRLAMKKKGGLIR